MVSAVTYAWEKLRDLFRDPDLPAMIQSHWHEIAEDQNEIPLDPDWDRYLALEEQGLFHCRVARRGGNGMLVGYCNWFVMPHLHYRSTIYATDDLFYVDPEERGGRVGYELIKGCEPHLKELGVKRLIIHDKPAFRDGRLEKLFEHMGYRLWERRWTKVI